MKIAVAECEFANARAQAGALAATVALRLREAIAARGSASLAVPGGETPREFLAALAREEIDWPHVDVTLTDERCVAPQDARSNERLLRELLIAPTQAQFAPLQREVARPFDVVVLGMGADGHCASLFADGDNIDSALRPDADESVMTMHATAAPEPRITLTLAALVDTRALFVLIRGVDKQRVLAAALRGDAPFDRSPIRAVLSHARTTPQIFWSP